MKEINQSTVGQVVVFFMFPRGFCMFGNDCSHSDLYLRTTHKDGREVITGTEKVPLMHRYLDGSNIKNEYQCEAWHG